MQIKKIEIKDIFSHEFVSGLKHKTPFFLFSKKKILDNINTFKNSLPGSDIYYAMKANFEPEILKIIDESGCGFEVASKYELAMLKKLNISPKKIIYGTSVKPAEHIKDFFDYGVDTFACDSFPELEKLALVAPGSKVYIRARVNDSGSVFQFSEKFGTDIKNVTSLLTRAKERGLIPYGISFHVGSQASNPKAWAQAIKDLTETINELEKSSGIKIEILNIGGGYPCKYASSEEAPEVEEITSEIKEELNNLPYQPKIILEPGRGVIADTAIVVTSVIARVERGSNTWLFLDAGAYNAFFEAMAYQGSTRYSITSLRNSYDSGEMMFSIAGPTGDSQDVISREVLLPKDIEVGDKLIFYSVGAYSLVAVSPFNGFPKPDIYIV